MLGKWTSLAITAVVGVLALGLLGWGRGQPARSGQVEAKQAGGRAGAAESPGRESDRAAIQQAAREFAEAFAKGDAKAAASHWTEQGEYHDERGEVLRGRAVIEKALSDHFKEKHGGRMEIQILSLRFPGRDIAVEEGILRQSGDGAELPNSTRYTTIHAREDGRWKIALSREWEIGQDRIDDLAWLLGIWKGTLKDQEVVLSFEREKDKPYIAGLFTRKSGGKVTATGTLKIGFDAQAGQLRSWHFEDDGGHGQSRWIRDGNHWLLDASGVLADGTETSGINVLARISKDEFTWQSVDRVAGDQALPDTLPIKLSRVSSGN
jgi:uncharacterized protein (TIGR02246 family)